MTYWHELTCKEREEAFEKDLTVDQFLATYEQPEWCGNKNALRPIAGCWRLFPYPKAICREYCQHCECFKK